MATLLTRIDEETYSQSNQDSEESPNKKNRIGQGMVQHAQSPPEPIKEEEEEEVSD